MTYVLVLFLLTGEVARFDVSEKLCVETLQAHRDGALIIAWDREGKQWPAERVLCVKKEPTLAEDRLS